MLVPLCSGLSHGVTFVNGFTAGSKFRDGKYGNLTMGSFYKEADADALCLRDIPDRTVLTFGFVVACS